MSLLRSVFVFVLPLVVAAPFVSGCVDPTNNIKCSATTDCPTQDQVAHEVIYDGGPDQPPIPACCAGYCVMESLGCDSGYRFVTLHNHDANLGECVANGFGGTATGALCPAPAGDMSVAADLTMSSSTDM